MKVLQIHDKGLGLSEKGDVTFVGAARSTRAGGLGVYLEQLVGALRGRGWQVSMIRFVPTPPGSDEAIPGFYQLRSSGYRFRPSVLTKLERILERDNPDIVHLHSVHYSLHPLMLRRLIRSKPTICTYHDVTPLCFWHTKLHPDGRLCEQPLGFRCLSRLCYRLGGTTHLLRDIVRVASHPLHLRAQRRLPMIATGSRYLRDALIQNGFPEDKIEVLPLFSRFEPEDPAEATETESTEILFVGRLEKEKGILEFLYALARLKGKPWTATVVGEGPLRETAGRLAGEFGIGARVRFAGSACSGDLAQHYRGCGFVVMPSLVPESFGLVGLEAMSFGKPVVGFSSGGIVEWLQDGVNGFLADHGDVEQLARRMERLVGDPLLRGRLGAAGLRLLKERFTLDRHLNRLLELYRQLIEERSRQRT